jgi:stage V sporulation protein SpoVS
MSDDGQHESAPGALKVSAKSNPNAVAGALAAVIRERESAEIQAVGAGAINQAIKAVAIARSYHKRWPISWASVASNSFRSATTIR